MSFTEVGKALGEAGWRIGSRGLKFKMPVLKQAGGGVGTAGGCVGLGFRGRAGEADVEMKNLGVPRLACGPSCSNGLRGAWSPGFEGRRGGDGSGRGDRGQQVGGGGLESRRPESQGFPGEGGAYPALLRRVPWRLRVDR